MVWRRDNLTVPQARTNITEDAEGKFTVTSSVARDLSRPYDVSLVMDVEEEDRTVEAQVQSVIFSGGQVLPLGRFSVLLAVLWGILVQHCNL